MNNLELSILQAGKKPTAIPKTTLGPQQLRDDGVGISAKLFDLWIENGSYYRRDTIDPSEITSGFDLPSTPRNG